MATKVNRATGNEAPLLYKERRKWDTKPRLLASIERASRLIDYQPLVDFEEGLAANVDWFQDNWELIEKLSDFKPGMNSAVRYYF